MTTKTQVLPKPNCPKCGSPIPAEAPQGLCPNCVMAQVTSDEGSTPKETGTEAPPSLQRVAEAFPNLEILEWIGRGGMGFVYKARQPHLDRYIALKILPEHLARDPQFAERFNREGRVLAKLNHPTIVSVFDFGRSGDFYFLSMEYVDGVNLRQAMQTAKFSPEEALNIVPHICEALQYAHEQGILHRDIKPENILLDTKGRVKIADFGIAKLIGELSDPQVTLTNTGSALGTPHYMAPEQLEQPGTVDHRADIYSLGVVFYEMLTGELPIGRFEPPSTKTPVGKGVDDVVFRALERNRERRQNSAGELKTEVETAANQPAPPPLPPLQSSLCWPGVIGAGLVMFGLLAFLVAGAVMASGGGTSLLTLLVVGLPLLLFSVTGTVLGWVGLIQIRHAAGSKTGLPLALFAAVAIPFGISLPLTIGLPATMAFKASQTPSLPLTITAFLTLATIVSSLVWSVVAIGRWAANRPQGQRWSLRGWTTTIAILTLLQTTLFLASPPSPERNAITPTPIQHTLRATDQFPAVQIQFQEVNLTQEPGQDRLELAFTREEHGSELSWRTDGQFKDTPVDITQSTHVDATSGDAVITHTLSLLLPGSLSQTDKSQLLQQVRQKWENQSLTVQPGDRHDVLTITQSPQNTVVLVLEGRLRQPAGE